MSTHELVDPNDAAFRLMSELLDVNFKTLNVTFETARDIVHSALRDGQCHVCGRRVGEGLHIITQEISAAMNDKTRARPPLSLPYEFVDVKISLSDLLEYSRKLGYERTRAAPKAAGRKPSALKLVQACIDKTYQGEIPSHITNDEIARAVGVSEKTVRRARGRG